ncbi:hypothetical protein OOU_Y34scaffold00845g2 [Pyricularia oryzae Y34]|uniref:Uncharacterized protein n=1 Tax=Pyricularia oryzae (strain Y34) TaxID=1143189 RepID=A0AA97PGQ1_PYRO3|nr:hypothetical protein OOU_Y34scaffold00845g2 [Pyricularia oryzae Y34]
MIRMGQNFSSGLCKVIEKRPRLGPVDLEKHNRLIRRQKPILKSPFNHVVLKNSREVLSFRKPKRPKRHACNEINWKQRTLSKSI